MTPNTFDRWFLALFATLITLIGMAFVFAVVFIVVPKENQQNASMALGFVLGTLLAAPIGFFYGASKAQPPAPPPLTTAPLTTALTVKPLPGAPTGKPGDPVAVHEEPATK
jgi:hypothetical protein